MASTQQKALSTYRRRLKRRGVVRLEVHVRKDDAALVRRVVKALADPEREGEARALLRERFGAGKAKGLKALLASAPLRGINLSRDPDFGRDVRLRFPVLIPTSFPKFAKAEVAIPKSLRRITRSMTRTFMSACWCSAKSAKALNGRAQQILAKLALLRSGFLL